MKALGRWFSAALFALAVAACGDGGRPITAEPKAEVAVAPSITTQPASVSVTDGASASMTVVAAGTDPLAYQWSRDSAPISGATAASYSIAAAALADNGAVFTVTVTNSAGSVTSSPATLSVAAVAPIISDTAARNIAVMENDSAALSVAATGSAPLSYQWYKNGVAISGATSANYDTGAVVLGDNNAVFYAVVTNAAGTATGPNLTLNVSALPVAPSIVTDLSAAMSVNGGSPAVFTVNATGTATLTYQWTRDSVVIPGATASTYTIASAKAADNGAVFAVTVTNGQGSVSSTASTLTVVQQPTTTVAGQVGVTGNADGTGSAATFNYPRGIAVAANGDVYIANFFGSSVRKMTPGGVVTTLIGGLNYAIGLAVDSAGNVYVSHNDHQISKIDTNGVATVLAGSLTAGSADGTGAAATFNSIEGLAVDSAGNVYVADSGNNLLRKVSPAGVVTTLAGSAGNFGSADGFGAAAQFGNPRGVAVDSTGNVYVADQGTHIIRKVSPAGDVTTLAGLANAAGSADGTAAARFSYPYNVAVDADGNVIVADAANNTIRKITPAGVVSTIAGTAGSIGSTDGVGAAARFDNPVAVAVDTAGNIFVSDYYNQTIRRVPAGY